MNKLKDFLVEEVLWNEVEKNMQKVHPQLCDAINSWSPKGPQYKLYKVNYPFGAKIFENGEFLLPLNDGSTISLNDARVPHGLKNDLSYSVLPVLFILNNLIEVFYEIDHGIATLSVFGKEVPVGLLETLEPKRSFCIRGIWSVSSGARSAFMLPKISDKIAHKRAMRAVHCNSPVPRHPFDHFQLFSSIAHSEGIHSDWNVELIIFSKKWFEKDKENHGWLLFYNTLMEILFRYTEESRNKITFDLLWHCFAQELNRKRKKTDPYILDTLKHLIKIAVGAAPGFSPAIDDNGGPYSVIKKLYVDVYGLQYVPTIMVPRHFVVRKNESPVYYSIHNPTLFESTPKNRETESLITDLIHVSSLLQDFLLLFKKGSLRLEGTLIKDILESVKFDFFHADPSQKYYGIHNSNKLPIEDPNFMKYGGTSNLKFSNTSSFIRNCVRISNLKGQTVIYESSTIPVT